MEIADIFKSNVLDQTIIDTLMEDFLGSDVKGYFGSSFELKIQKNFNGLNHGFKLYTIKGAERISKFGLTIDMNGHCSSLHELQEESKKTESKFSAADLLLFKEEGTTLHLVDWCSLKTCRSSSISINNDGNGLIHDSLINDLQALQIEQLDRTKLLKNIGKVIMLFLDMDTGKHSTFTYDGEYAKLLDSICLVEKEDEFTRVYDLIDVSCNRQHLTTKNRKTQKKGAKSTSFSRGIKIDKVAVEQSPNLFQKISEGSVPIDQIEKEAFGV